MRWLSGLVTWMFGLPHAPTPQPSDERAAKLVVEGQIAETAPALTNIQADLAAERTRRAANQCLLWPVTNTDRRRKLWCGPTVVSTLIGIDAAVARDIIKQSRGGRAVMGTTARELDMVFRAHGCRLDLLIDHKGDLPTFATWLRLPRDPVDAFVVEVTGHWVAVRGNWFCDTFTKGQPVKVLQAPHKRKRVRRVYRVSRLR